MTKTQIVLSFVAEYLFVVGEDFDKTEIVSLTEGGTIPDCLSSLSDHPNSARYTAGGALPEAGEVNVFCCYLFLYGNCVQNSNH